MDVLVVDHARKLDARIETQLLQHLEQQAVLLEAVAAATTLDDAVEEAVGVEGEGIAQSRSDAAERKGRHVRSRDPRQERQARRGGLEIESVQVAMREGHPTTIERACGW